MGASAFLKSVDFTTFGINVKTIAPKKYLYQFGHAIWWGDMPMIVYNFLESYDFSDKTVVPFCTHGGSGLSGTESTTGDITEAKMMDGFAISGETAQNQRDRASEAVTEWLREGGLIE